MNDQQLLRYSRHILLPALAYEGQQRLTQSHALIVGLGGLGAPAALYLGASGVGRLTLCDFDMVEISNLQRQIIHTTAAIGQLKAVSAQSAILALNPDIAVSAITDRLDGPTLAVQVAAADVVLDCSDNFNTRYALNKLCKALKKPLVSGAAIHFTGQISVFDARDPEAPCYHCLFPDTGTPDEMRCSENGVFSPLVGIIGSMQAAEAVKILANVGESLRERLLLLDAHTMEWRSLRIPRDPACPVCHADHHDFSNLMPPYTCATGEGKA